MTENRILVLDLELTGLDLKGGDRIASLGLVEMFDHVRIGEGKEWFFNPEGRAIDSEGQKIHGLTSSFLEQYPPFSSQIEEIENFIGDSPIAHHCWLYEDGPLSVDEAFMKSEFEKAGRTPIDHARWTNMKDLAKRIDPDQNSLNAMLDRFGIDRTSRETGHGALLDARLTAQLYLKYCDFGYKF